MIPHRIAGATHYLSAPEGWDAESQGPLWPPACARAAGKVCESAWEPTPDELAALHAGGSVILSVVGGQPPVMLSVQAPPTEDGL
jgi:hypothetical protein